MDKLAEICATKREEVRARRQAVSLAALEAQAAGQEPPRGFARTLQAKAANGFALIAEIKKASPSKGLIRSDFQPANHAHDYASGGAACLSVLTDAPYFQGHESYLVEARAACALPVLRKDFMVDPWQVLESRAIGADAILIIVAALDTAAMHEIEAAALELGMDVLVEVHEEREMERAAQLRSRLIGINNRDLKSFVTDLGTTERLAPLAPEGSLLVAESGIATHADLQRLARCGARSFLVGESLMRQADIIGATRALLEGGMTMGPLTHLDEHGHARMVDVGGKAETRRSAVAAGRITMTSEALTAIRSGSGPKGDVLGAARIAGIMAAKKTAELIPLCHPLALDTVEITFAFHEDAVEVTAGAALSGRTGVEMEAMTATCVALLTLYDMAKALDKAMVIGDVRLIEKRGGKSGDWRRPEPA